MFDTTYCPRQTCVFPPDRFVQLYYFHFGVCKCTLLNSNWVVLIRKSCGSTHSQIKNPTHIKTSREANHHISIQKHWKDTQIDKLFSFFLLTIEDECSNSMSYVGTKLLPGIAYRHGHWPWVQFINIDTGQADHDCPRRGGGDKNQSLLDVLKHDSLQFHYGDFKTEFIDVGLHVKHYLQTNVIRPTKNGN